MQDAQQLRNVLLQNDEEYRHLAEQHNQLDVRLNEIVGHAYPSNAEEIEKATLKKRKLQMKDRMERILRRHQADVPQEGEPAVDTA
jgi:uncharacterized protein YdcH (DUF465 family)